MTGSICENQSLLVIFVLPQTSLTMGVKYTFYRTAEAVSVLNG